MFPATARYGRSHSPIDIGDQESFGFVVRATGYGELDFEDDKTDTPAEAMAALDTGLIRWFAGQAVEIKEPACWKAHRVQPRTSNQFKLSLLD